MKLAIAFAAVAAVSPAAAFTAGLARTSRRVDLRLAARVDSSDLVDAAMKITEKFGSTSSEARLAWETVEEVDASDNSVASMGSLNDECEIEAEVIPQECLDYSEALEELQELLPSTKPVEPNTNSVEPVKLPAPGGVAASQSKELQAALEDAHTVTAEKGLASPEAKVAWLTVEEIAASGNSNALGGALTEDNCFVEEAVQEACVALEELNKLIGAPFADKVVAMLSTEEGTEEMRALWEDLDKDNDGKVSGKEWGSQVYAKQDVMSEYFGGSSLQEIGEGFNRIDTNGDDSLTWEEFVAEVASYKAVQQLKAALSSEEGKIELRNLWYRLDKDWNGKVSGKEWGSMVWNEKKVMAKFFGGTDMASIGNAFNRIDRDGSDSLTWQEFKKTVGSY
jgi:Ca2+-binding EF-hand superfamily protein